MDEVAEAPTVASLESQVAELKAQVAALTAELRAWRQRALCALKVREREEADRCQGKQTIPAGQ